LRDDDKKGRQNKGRERKDRLDDDGELHPAAAAAQHSTAQYGRSLMN